MIYNNIMENSTIIGKQMDNNIINNNIDIKI